MKNYLQKDNFISKESRCCKTVKLGEEYALSNGKSKLIYYNSGFSINNDNDNDSSLFTRGKINKSGILF